MGNENSGTPLSWDEYFLTLAKAVAKKSKDPNCPVGAVIVNRERLVLSTGFNGFARTLKDDPNVLADKTAKLEWMVHAEHNAILNAARLGVSTIGCTLYVDKFPCFTCLQAIVQSGIVRIFTDDKEYWRHDPADPSADGKRYIIRQSGIEVVAPNHSSYRPPPLPELKKGVRKSGVPSAPPGAPAPDSVPPRSDTGK